MSAGGGKRGGNKNTGGPGGRGAAGRGKSARAGAKPSRLGDGSRLAALRAGKSGGTAKPSAPRQATSQSRGEKPSTAPATPAVRTASQGAAPVDRAGRELFRKVRTAKGRRLSSTTWLQRQLNDPYVAAAQAEGLRSRAAFKLAEIDDRYNLFKPGQTIVDLGAAPGGWSVVAAQRVNAERWIGDAESDHVTGEGAVPQPVDTGQTRPIGQVVAVDILPMESVTGVHTLELDFTSDEAEDIVRGLLRADRIDGVLTDMAAPTTGHRQTDHLRIMDLCEVALDFAYTVLSEDGFFLAKMFQGGTENALLTRMKQRFKSVRHVKPPASRADSAEMYVLATGFRSAADGRS